MSGYLVLWKPAVKDSFLVTLMKFVGKNILGMTMIVLKSCITPIGKDQMRDALVTVSKPFVLLQMMFLILIVQHWHWLIPFRIPSHSLL